MSEYKTPLILLAIGLFSILIVSGLGCPRETLAMDKKDCSVTIAPEESLQETIDEVQTGSKICLRKGRWNEGVVINKSLTIKGLEGKSEIYRTRENLLTIYATAKAELVKLQNLKISSYARGDGPRPIVFAEAPLVMEDCLISQEEKSRKWGLIFAAGPSRQQQPLSLKVSDTSFNKVGLSIFPTEGSVKSLLKDSSVKSNYIGIQAGKLLSDGDDEYEGPRAEVVVDSCSIKGAVKGKESGIGVSLSHGAVLNLVNSNITDFPNEGIEVIGAGEATVTSSVIKANGGNGISLKDHSRARVIDSRITQNGGYGVAIQTGSCGLTEGTEAVGFLGSITGNKNKISENTRGPVCPEELSFLTRKKMEKPPLPTISSTERDNANNPELPLVMGSNPRRRLYDLARTSEAYQFRLGYLLQFSWLDRKDSVWSSRS